MPDLYAWIGVDAYGEQGLVTVTTPLGLAPACYATERVARRAEPWAQARADELGVPVRLVRYVEAESIGDVRPRKPRWKA